MHIYIYILYIYACIAKILFMDSSEAKPNSLGSFCRYVWAMWPIGMWQVEQLQALN